MNDSTGSRCRELRPLLSAWFDGELDRAQRDGLERHLPHCSDCSVELQDVTRVSAAVHRLLFADRMDLAEQDEPDLEQRFARVLRRLVAREND